MGSNAASGFQDVAGDGEFVGGRADVTKRVMQDEVFKMNEFTVDPEGGMCLEEMRAFEKALPDGRAGDALIEPGKCDGGFGDWPQQALDGQSDKIVRH
ncbi:MAG: hypothetical protein K0M60_14935 [Hydrogenophaga sp.]|nr:hypothetical protein [Hydrogenophaga sp.]